MDKSRKRNPVGQFLSQEIDGTPRFELGYFAGWLLGDGSLFQGKNRIYRVTFTTTIFETHQFWLSMIKSCFPDLNQTIPRVKLKTRTFPNGTTRTDPMYNVTLNSKTLYELFAPYKLKDYHWRIPAFLTTRESQLGFLKGIFDAEGCITRPFITKDGYMHNHVKVCLISKHRDNIVPVYELLKDFNIVSRIEKGPRGQTRLVIQKIKDIENFTLNIGFGLQKKQDKLIISLAFSKYRRDTANQRKSESMRSVWASRRSEYGRVA